MLDPIDPKYLFPVFSNTFETLKKEKLLDTYRSYFDTYLIAMDGTWFYSSEKISCEQCLHKDHRDGKRTYYHSAITPVIVKPGCNKVISLEPEFIQKQDGKEKQDCENAAAKRWLLNKGLKYIQEGATLLGDDLYCRQPICEIVLSNKGNFIFTCKASSHKYLYEWIDAFDPKENVIQIIEAGRSRWKIENEHNNTLKTKGYNLSNNFGHGIENLSNLLLALNLLAFLFHTVLEYLDKRYALIRKTLPRRATFFNDLRALTRYICFLHWQDLMLFMLRGLELEDPGG